MCDFERPFPHLHIDDYSHFFKLDGRFRCEGCNRSRKFFCYSCSLSFPDVDQPLPPKVRLPFTIDIIKHKQEVDGKSTSSHAKILTDDQVNILIYPEIPDYRKCIDDVVLIFVSPDAVDVKNLLRGYKKFKLKDNYGMKKGNRIGTLLKKDLSEIVAEEQTLPEQDEGEEQSFPLDALPFKKAVFIDSTWKQCRSIYLDPRVRCLNAVVIQNRKTIFWRKQKDAPDWFLSTIEAIHQFLLEVHVHAWGIEKSYYDNCLQDLKLYNTDWISPEKIFDTKDPPPSPSEEEKREEEEKFMTPYNGQYDNILYFYSFNYSLIHSLNDPYQCLRIYD